VNVNGCVDVGVDGWVWMGGCATGICTERYTEREREREREREPKMYFVHVGGLWLGVCRRKRE